jgi:hypothetical protein
MSYGAIQFSLIALRASRREMASVRRVVVTPSEARATSMATSRGARLSTVAEAIRSSTSAVHVGDGLALSGGVWTVRLAMKAWAIFKTTASPSCTASASMGSMVIARARQRVKFSASLWTYRPYTKKRSPHPSCRMPLPRIRRSSPPECPVDLRLWTQD